MRTGAANVAVVIPAHPYWGMFRIYAQYRRGYPLGGQARLHPDSATASPALAMLSGATSRQ